MVVRQKVKIVVFTRPQVHKRGHRLLRQRRDKDLSCLLYSLMSAVQKCSTLFLFLKFIFAVRLISTKEFRWCGIFVSANRQYRVNVTILKFKSTVYFFRNQNFSACACLAMNPSPTVLGNLKLGRIFCIIFGVLWQMLFPKSCVFKIITAYFWIIFRLTFKTFFW